MFRLKFWALLLSLSAIVIGAGQARFAYFRARELRLNPPIVVIRPPEEGRRHQRAQMVAREDRFGRMSPSHPRRGPARR